MKKLASLVLALIMIFCASTSAFAATNRPSDARQVLGYVNDERIAAGLDPLEWDSALVDFAYVRANEIITLWSHTRPNGQQAIDYPDVNGENLAYGTIYTAADVVKGWMNSPGHRENILRPQFTSMAVACVEETKNVAGYGNASFWYWVQIFHQDTGKPRATTTETTSASSAASERVTTSTPFSLSNEVDAKSVISALEQKDSSKATIKNADTLGKAAIAEIIKWGKSKGRSITLVNNTYHSSGEKVQGQMSISVSDYANRTEDLKLGVYTEMSDVSGVETRLSQWYSNKMVIVKMDEEGTLPGIAKIAADVDLSGLDTKNLQFSVFKAKANTVQKIAAPNYVIDDKNYLHFETKEAGYIIITDTKLAK